MKQRHGLFLVLALLICVAAGLYATTSTSRGATWIAYVAFGLILAALWLLAGVLLAINFGVVWRASRAKPGERVPSGFPFLAGGMCAVMVLVTLPLAEKLLKITVPWPWLWVLLPLLLDPLGLGRTILWLPGANRARRPDDAQ